MTAGGPRGAGAAGGRGGGSAAGRPRTVFDEPPPGLTMSDSFEDEGEDWEMDFMQEGVTGSTSASLEDDGEDLPVGGGGSGSSRGDSMEREPTSKAQGSRGKGGSTRGR